MRASSIEIKKELLALAAGAGFVRARVLAPFEPGEPDPERAGGGGYREGSPSALAVALPYGNDRADDALPFGPGTAAARLDAFSRRNYYAEAVVRLRRTAAAARARFGGGRSGYRVFCNSPVPEKPPAAACGLGFPGRNTLLMAEEAGSLFVAAFLTLPFELEGDGPVVPEPHPCDGCFACAAACPTGALDGSDPRSPRLDRGRCIQWFASRPGPVPEAVAAAWGDRLYGCSVCRDVCPANARRIPGAATELGALPAAFDADALAAASDEEIRNLFRGTALGQSWLGPEAVRRNARLAAGRR